MDEQGLLSTQQNDLHVKHFLQVQVQSIIFFLFHWFSEYLRLGDSNSSREGNWAKGLSRGNKSDKYDSNLHGDDDFEKRNDGRVDC